MIILLVIAGIAGFASVGGVVLASRREDSAHSLAGRPAGVMEAAARRVVGFHGDGLGRGPGDSRATRPARGDEADWDTGGGSIDRPGPSADADAGDVPHLVG